MNDPVGPVLHYFGPNPFKIGDSLLTVELLQQAVDGHREVLCYASPLIAEILVRFELPRTTFRTGRTLKESVRTAHAVQMQGSSLLDVQQVNLWIDHSHWRHLFDDAAIPGRARMRWDSPKALAEWGATEFVDVLRQVLRLPVLPPSYPTLHVEPETGQPGDTILLFPHCESPEQQLSGWAEIARTARRAGHAVTVVGTNAVRALDEPWPNGTEFATDLRAQELVRRIARSAGCVGGATGLAHLASVLDKPCLFLWGYDNSFLFRPRRGAGTEHYLALGEAREPRLVHERIASFLASLRP